jgi:hypothetical protein
VGTSRGGALPPSDIRGRVKSRDVVYEVVV